MATIYIKHHDYPDNPQAFVLDVNQIVKTKGEDNTDFWQDGQGESYWEVIIYTSGLDVNGNSLGPYWADTVGSSTDLDELIRNKISEACQEIDWSRSSGFEDLFTAGEDHSAPVVSWQYPIDGQVNVPIDSRISLRIKDLLPGNGIDISTLVFKVNGLTVIPDIEGNKYDYTISYRPVVSK